MTIVADILALLCLLVGVAFMFLGALGVMRLPDVYHRLHGATKATTLGLVGLLLAVVFHVGEMVVLIKAAVTLLFAFVAVPVGSHVLARAAMFDRAHQWEGTLSDEHAEDRLEGGVDVASDGESAEPMDEDSASFEPMREDGKDSDSDYRQLPGQATQ